METLSFALICQLADKDSFSDLFVPSPLPLDLPEEQISWYPTTDFFFGDFAFQTKIFSPPTLSLKITLALF